MVEKIENLKDSAVDFCEENSGTIILGVYTLMAGALTIGTLVMLKKYPKWYGREVGKEIAKALK